MTAPAASRTELIEAHLGLVGALARRYANRGEPLEDLVQIGCVALIHAVDRFDPRRGVPLEAYAAATIAGEIQRHLRDVAQPVRLPRRVRQDIARARGAERELAASLGRWPTASEIGARIGAPAPAVAGALLADRTLPLPEGHPAAGDALAAVEARADLRTAVAALDERERLAVGLRYVAGLPRAQVAERLGLSEVHISRLIGRARRKLAASLGRV